MNESSSSPCRQHAFFVNGTWSSSSSYFFSKNFIFLNRLDSGLEIFLETPIVPTIGTKPVIRYSDVLAMSVIWNFLPLEPYSLLVSTIIKVHGSNSI